ncbi:hypothetical protein QYE76_047837 [Lolium multiflorum]|uniref:Reverse transcriptase Ty1/copia-type domain-containing protein n=1 Tax=Lolium multiflorum TaxID=4521 RepID=A0AAD8X0J7_LOLMU|nr:hypothetical protein QYE76_047837 [Lolium multiflorum]
MENYSLLMGDSSVDGDGGGVDGGAFRGHFPVPAACQDRDSCPPDLGFAMAAALEGFSYRGFFRIEVLGPGALYSDEGIVRHHTIPYTPQQNGVAERMNRTIISKARCMLSNADVTDAVDFSDNSDDEQQRISVQVEHVEEKENDVAEIDNIVVQHSPPILQQTNSSIAADRPRCNKGPRPRLIEECNLVHHALSCAEQVEHDTEPATYTEAVASVDRVKWISAMQEEMQSLDKNGTWDVVPLPKEKKAVRCKWIFKRKEDLSPNEPPRYKARLVAKGFSQIPGIDYNDVFSPVVKHSSIRAFFGIVAMRDLELEQLDVKTAFLHGELEEEIYMDQPEGFVVPGKEDLVCKLKRSLYGLKQSPRQWYKRFDSFMLAHEFKRSKYDSCVYIKFVNGSPIYLLLYVDDMLIAAKRKKEITTLKSQLSSEFEMKDLGAAKKILGMEITRDRKSSVLFLSQQNYIQKVLHRFNMHDAKSVSTPIASHFKLSALQCPSIDEDIEYMSRVPYSSAVGSLMYAMVCSRPDLSYAMSLVSRYLADPGKKHWRAVQWIFSQSAIYLTKYQMFHERTKHIDIKYHYIRDIVAQGKLKIATDFAVVSVDAVEPVATFLMEEWPDSDDSGLEELLDNDMGQLVVLLAAKELADRKKKRQRGSKMGRLCAPRNHALSHNLLMHDYFFECDDFGLTRAQGD